MRLPSTPTTQVSAIASMSLHNTPPSSATLSNGFAEAQMATVAEDGEQEPKPVLSPTPNGVPAHAEATPTIPAAPASSPPLAPVKAAAPIAPVSTPNLPSTYNAAAVGAFPALMARGMPYPYPVLRPNGMTLPQYMSDSSTMQAQANMMRQAGGYINHNGYTMQMQGGRPIQWLAVATQRSPSLKGADANGAENLNGSPSRAPSANGMRVGQVNQLLNGNQGRASHAGTHMQRLMPQSPSPHMLSPSMAATQIHTSPSRSPAVPNIPTPSPSLQTRQVVGASGAAGY